eukprot:1138726-Pelagomonas_calceolata.AAC.4
MALLQCVRMVKRIKVTFKGVVCMHLAGHDVQAGSSGSSCLFEFGVVRTGCPATQPLKEGAQLCSGAPALLCSAMQHAAINGNTALLQPPAHAASHVNSVAVIKDARVTVTI